MKRRSLFVSLFGIGLLGFSMLNAQNPVQIYPYRMDPRKHPDDLRHAVKAPDASLFGNKTQFISLRDLSVTDYKQRINQWVHKDKLGDILWVSYPLIFQENLPEVVAEIKKQNLYLFDLWGYIPGSGPGGYWQQFVIPSGVLELFESELGERWLGMDNGEQDGRYVGSFAPRMHPLGLQRKQQYFNFQRHFQEMGDQLGNKLATLVSLNFGHYFIKEGIYTLIGAETAQGLPNSQIYYSFIRGAGKQYGVNWFGNASVWNRWGHKTYSADATGDDNDYGSGGPLKGTSLSLLKRLMYTHLFYNCVAVGFEGAMRMDDESLSPIGKIQQDAVQWSERHGDLGVMHTPIAFMTDFFSGWSFPRHLYSRDAYKVWGNLPYERSDYMTDNFLDILYPGYQDASYYRDERGFITPTPFGDMTDCLMSDAPLWVLQQYPVLVIAGELQGGKEIKDKLQQYVETGGHLVITSSSLKNMPEGISGVTATGSLRLSREAVRYGDRTITEVDGYLLDSLDYLEESRILQFSGDRVAALERPSGKGKLTVIASPYAQSEAVKCALPVFVQEEKPLGKPYPILNHVRVLLEDIFVSQQLFETNPALSMVTTVKNPREYHVLLTNSSWEPVSFAIQARVGKIASIRELPISEKEMKALGYTPKVVTCKNGVNTEGQIAGGSTRAFKIRLEDPRVQLLQEAVPAKAPAKRGLALHHIQNLKEEILNRPTFFEHYDRVIIDWRYLEMRDTSCIEQEAGWLKRQKIGITVDLTSGLNLYPDLRIVNNDSLCYARSMQRMKMIMDKMTLLGAHDLILSSQRSIENNYSSEQFAQSLAESLINLADYAAERDIRILFRPAYKRVGETAEQIMKLYGIVNRPNFKLAPSLSLLLIGKDSQGDLAKLTPDVVGAWMLSLPEKDMHGQIWNMSAPLSTDRRQSILTKIVTCYPDAALYLDGLYNCQDEEYEDIQIIKSLEEKQL